MTLKEMNYRLPLKKKMMKMFFSQPVINRYFETVSLADIEKKHTIVFFGGFGSGKTHATTALGIEVCNRDYKVKLFTLTMNGGLCLQMSSLPLQLSTILFITGTW